MDQRLPDIGIDMAGQRSEPGLHRVDALADAGEAQTVDDPLDDADLFPGASPIGIADGDGRCIIAESDMVAAKRLKREIGIDHLVVCIAVGERHRLVHHHFAHQLGDGLALVEPLAANLRQRLGRRRLVERNEPGRPATGEILMVEGIENAGSGCVGKSQNGEGAQVPVAQHRFDPARQRRIDQQAVEIHRRLQQSDNVTTGRDAAVQEGQRLAIIERANLRHEACEQVLHPVGFGDEGAEVSAPVAILLGHIAFQQRALGAADLIGGRQIAERKMGSALEMLSPAAVEMTAPFLIDQPGGRIGERAVGIIHGFDPFGIEEKGPARSETPQRIVGTGTDRQQFDFGRAFKIRATKAQGSLEAAVLVKHDARRHQRCPWQMVGQPVGRAAIFLEVQHER